ncbi:MAG TPA: hypothetical protein P5016_03750 [Verrucomicrobiales bacterium]|nr:hypothetical protein [Verrucomicrobiae bacterium]MCP5552900.1 hypothetical protein [Akkermansiaceae bacterium]HRX53593.1 hypothetical protein [Verrucomicrobiales bacterium]
MPQRFANKLGSRFLPLVAVASVLLQLPAAWAATDYDSPKFDYQALDLDGLSLAPNQRTEIAEALAGLASNFPTDSTVDTDLREKALGLGLMLDPFNGSARLAHLALSEGRTPEKTQMFSTRSSIASVLWRHAKQLVSPDAEPEDRKLAPLLMEISLLVDPSPETDQIALYDTTAKASPPDWQRIVVIGGGTRGSSDLRLASLLRRLLIAERLGTVNPGDSDTSTKSAASVVLPPVPPSDPLPLPTKLEPIAPSMVPSVVAGPNPPGNDPAPQVGARQAVSPLKPVRLKFLAQRNNSEESLGSAKFQVELIDLALEPEAFTGPPSGLPADPDAVGPVVTQSLFLPSPSPRPYSMRDLRAASEILAARWKLPEDQRFSIRAHREVPEENASLRAQLGSVFGNATANRYAPVTLGLILMAESSFQGDEIDPGVAVSGMVDSDGDWLPPEMRPHQMWTQAMKCGAGVLLTKTSPIFEGGLSDLLIAGQADLILSVQALVPGSFEEAVRLISVPRDPELEKALALFREIQALRSRMSGEEIVKNIKVQERLEQVLAAVPNHLTAKVLLDFGKNGSTRTLGLEPSRQLLSDLMVDIQTAIRREEEEPGNVTETEGLELVAAATNTLRGLKARLAPEAKDLAFKMEDALKACDTLFRIKNRETSMAVQKRNEVTDQVKSVLGAAN